MKDNISRQDTYDLMRRHGIRPTHSLGQNFLVDEAILEAIVSAAELGKQDLVLEIGPGLGHLTVLMAAEAARVIAIEIDRHLLPVLKETTGPFDNIEIIHADALTVNLPHLLKDWTGPHKMVANLPYYITTPLIMKMLSDWPTAERLVLTIQNEAADRILAKPGQGAYGPLAVLCQLYGAPVRRRVIPGDAFVPRPNVESCLIVINGRSGQPASIEWPALARFLTAGFATRRKKLSNVLHSHVASSLTKEDIAAVFNQLGLSDNARAEELPPETWYQLFQLLS